MSGRLSPPPAAATFPVTCKAFASAFAPSTPIELCSRRSTRRLHLCCAPQNQTLTTLFPAITLNLACAVRAAYLQRLRQRFGAGCTDLSVTERQLSKRVVMLHADDSTPMSNSYAAHHHTAAASAPAPVQHPLFTILCSPQPMSRSMLTRKLSANASAPAAPISFNLRDSDRSEPLCYAKPTPTQRSVRRLLLQPD
jgi:hypothetical protein